MQRTASIRVALTALGLACAACNNGAPPPQATSPIAPAAGATVPALPAAGSAGIPAPPPMEARPDAMPQAVPDAGPPAIPMPTDAMVQVVEEEDAGPWVPAEPECVDGQWRLAAGFLLARKVDYIADRMILILDGGVLDDKLTILSSAGIPCASASNKHNCMAGLALPVTEQGRHLVTTAGDNVRLWSSGGAGALLGLIDTKSDALWWALTRGGYLFTCETKIATDTGGFNIRGAVSSACGPVPNPSTHRPLNLWVSERGEILELGLQDPEGFLCGQADAGMPVAGTSGSAGFGQL